VGDVDTQYLALLAWPVVAALGGWILAVIALNLDLVVDHWTRRPDSPER
jgi:hypothetical protein